MTCGFACEHGPTGLPGRAVGEVRRRLDVEMVRRGLASSRSEAALAIRAGKVTIGGRPALKASTLVASDEPIGLAGPARRFVSRGGEKLDAALGVFSVRVREVTALDAGASTGGFTDCLLTRGAKRVFAVDVGYGQLDWRLRADPRVMVLERTNVRDLRPEDLPEAPDVVTADLSFISLSVVIPALVRSAKPGADFVVLVKPQFEAGRSEVGDGGVVSDPEVWRRVLRSVVEAFRAEGLSLLGLMPSPLVGPAGNVEFLLHARAAAGPRSATPTDGAIDDVVQGGIALAGNRG
jgi:23S rRNA (cytidine1920-2'-O)/16S rRNA (cytidine1409-2'-O)-methyltransferase